MRLVLSCLSFQLLRLLRLQATLQALQSLASASFLQDTGLVPDSVRDSAADCSLKFCFDPQGHVPCMSELVLTG